MDMEPTAQFTPCSSKAPVVREESPEVDLLQPSHPSPQSAPQDVVQESLNEEDDNMNCYADPMVPLAISSLSLYEVINP